MSLNHSQPKSPDTPDVPDVPDTFGSLDLLDAFCQDNRPLFRPSYQLDSPLSPLSGNQGQLQGQPQGQPQPYPNPYPNPYATMQPYSAAQPYPNPHPSGMQLAAAEMRGCAARASPPATVGAGQLAPTRAALEQYSLSGSVRGSSPAHHGGTALAQSRRGTALSFTEALHGVGSRQSSASSNFQGGPAVSPPVFETPVTLSRALGSPTTTAISAGARDRDHDHDRDRDRDHDRDHGYSLGLGQDFLDELAGVTGLAELPARDTDLGEMDLSGEIPSSLPLDFGSNDLSSGNEEPPVKREDAPEIPQSQSQSQSQGNQAGSGQSAPDAPRIPITKAGKPRKIRKSHNIIEKKYRTNINHKMIQLKKIVPSLRIAYKKECGIPLLEQDNLDLDGLPAATKLNKAVILMKTIEYIKHLENKCALLQGAPQMATQLEAQLEARQNNPPKWI
ncbi:hypothetical protein TBLA_0J00820 [Henningerozyma blattae CBS 6284]|uniref:BHLH domain-containing protein n=1 Tax=Henningerozyma blattae (strain ATCC 34711 / CBS 6284 / DSM 70876 / NBRC 10599 / NRRL Y-10934 / UCD 77-7) TaxID=1071380 RepID=I2H9M8_HENB6|nr:hypothetical protein TBLA_0J00820 [Tetrapisispora blattae CBS 6284]CCH63080.1 hypothetical protein TBLA_0J00820 [Tetrapisispora blattae CBS 6284]